ncbi:methyltransferase domain-containing protein [Jatrophihabitans fulvus]
MTSALSMYEHSLRSRTELFTRPAAGGRVTRLDTARYLADADDTDRSVLDHCAGPVLDIGCGPGRMLAACAQRGLPATGIDVAAGAVAHARSHGGRAVLADVFGDVPDAGAWGSVLLLDGNIGIGGDPVRLLRRVRDLLAPGGRAVVEVEAYVAGEFRGDLVLVDASGGCASRAFPWARLGLAGLAVAAVSAGLTPGGHWTADGRGFSVLERP